MNGKNKVPHHQRDQFSFKVLSTDGQNFEGIPKLTAGFSSVPASRIFCTGNFYLPHHQGSSIDEPILPDILKLTAGY